MIGHVFMYRLKCLSRNKTLIFWTLLFPLLLGTVYKLAFSNLAAAEEFVKINIAVVDNIKYHENKEFKMLISTNDIFNVKAVDKSQAVKMLKDSKVDGYIEVDNEIKLFVNKSGLNQTIIKSFLDDFNQTSSAIQNILAKEPAAYEKGVFNDLLKRDNYLKEVPISKSNPDNTVIYFYLLIAMVCMYGGFWGIQIINDAQANLSAIGARINLVPVHKLKLLTIDIIVALLLQFTIVLLLIAYLVYILKIDFGNQIGFVLLNSLVGSFMGISSGTFIGSLIKKESIKIGITISFSLLMCFLAGMMYIGIKYLVIDTFPVMEYINPANLLADAYYCLYYYDNYSKFTLNVMLLMALSIAFSMGTYLLIRRKKYASI